MSGGADDPPAARIAPPDFLSGPAAAAVLAALPGARAVGGAVRDALAGRDVADVDVAAPLPPGEIAARLEAAGMRVHATGLAHGTVTAVLRGQPVEVTSLRRDVVTDGRHAVVEWTTDWREDAARRDFTINAMSLSAGGALWDYFDGRADLAAGRVRFVGEAAARLAEDRLRALRWFRFQARYGRGAPDAAAVAAIRDSVPGLALLSAERVWMELKRLLAAPDPTGAVALMEGTGVLRAILPEVEGAGASTGHAVGLPALRRLIRDDAPGNVLLRLAALLAPLDASGLARLRKRLRWSENEWTFMGSIARVSGQGPAFAPLIPVDAAMDERTLRAWVATATPDIAEMQTWLSQARDGVDRSGLRRRIDLAGFPKFPLHGRDALALGLEPGPDIGRLISEVLRWWLDGGCIADADACRVRLAELIGDIQDRTLPQG